MSIQMRYGAGKDSAAGMLELVWENSAPTSAFAAQTVSLDLSPYAAVAVEINLMGSATEQAVGIVMMGTAATIFGRPAAAATTYGRQAAVSTIGVVFSNGHNGSTYGQSYAIPRRIWGIR